MNVTSLVLKDHEELDQMLLIFLQYLRYRRILGVLLNY